MLKKKLHILDEIFLIGTFFMPIVGIVLDLKVFYSGAPIYIILSNIVYAIFVAILGAIAEEKKIQTEFCKIWVVLFAPLLYVTAVLLEPLMVVAVIYMIISKFIDKKIKGNNIDDSKEEVIYTKMDRF